MHCPNCTAWLVEHRARRELHCHHCGHAVPIPAACPACEAEHSLTAVGPGVERITEEAAGAVPRRAPPGHGQRHDARPARRARRRPAPSTAREVDLIIGTQIVAKGWHFPHLTLVGVVDADLGLAGGDLRAAERTVQLLHQVAGRAGRAEAPGRVLLQTFSPEHPVMQALIAGRPGGVHGARGGGAPARQLAAVWPAGGADRQRRHRGGGRHAGPRPGPGGAARRRRAGARPGSGAAGDPARPAPAAAAAEDAARHRRCSRCCASGWRQVPVRGSARVDVDVDPVSFL